MDTGWQWECTRLSDAFIALKITEAKIRAKWFYFIWLIDGLLAMLHQCCETNDEKCVIKRSINQYMYFAVHSTFAACYCYTGLSEL